MPRRDPEEYETLDKMVDVAEFCEVRPGGPGTPECRVQIKTMAYQGTGACGEGHLKIKNNDYGTVKTVGVNPTGDC